MNKNILLIQGHPDTSQEHLCHALEHHYAQGAVAAGHKIRTIKIAELDFPLLKSQKEWETGATPERLKKAQEDILWANHLVFFFPLWLGDMPAVVKGFLEQVARPYFAFIKENKNPFAKKALTGRSARVIVTMGMPAIVYRWYFRAHSVKSLERNILGFIGIHPVNETLIGMVDTLDSAKSNKWFQKMQALGNKAE
jgi:putative NADPH-quinone reductase